MNAPARHHLHGVGTIGGVDLFEDLALIEQACAGQTLDGGGDGSSIPDPFEVGDDGHALVLPSALALHIPAAERNDQRAREVAERRTLEFGQLERGRRALGQRLAEGGERTGAEAGLVEDAIDARGELGGGREGRRIRALELGRPQESVQRADARNGALLHRRARRAKSPRGRSLAGRSLRRRPARRRRVRSRSARHVHARVPLPPSVADRAASAERCRRPTARAARPRGRRAGTGQREPRVRHARRRSNAPRGRARPPSAPRCPALGAAAGRRE